MSISCISERLMTYKQTQKQNKKFTQTHTQRYNDMAFFGHDCDKGQGRNDIFFFWGGGQTAIRNFVQLYHLLERANRASASETCPFVKRLYYCMDYITIGLSL